ncbi:MAG: sulfite exporter TauE/SafE family protein [bacterium]|nr:sulfite exporter TauE/SafE family protein [bacterium]
MTTEFSLLLGTSAALGFVHTLLGPDHYVPFIAMSRARNWSRRRTMVITALCGVGHVSSSVIIGLVGLFFGVEVLKLTALESVRGEIAGWLLFGFGLAYMLWGIRRALRSKARTLVHAHESAHDADHSHESHVHGRHTHVHPETASITPWVLFTIFVFGPCEPLIPLIMYPAATSSVFSVIAVAVIFSLVTLGTMLALVYAASRGLEFVSFRRVERYSHALAGFVVALCGAGIQFLGL